MVNIANHNRALTASAKSWQGRASAGFQGRYCFFCPGAAISVQMPLKQSRRH